MATETPRVIRMIQVSTCDSQAEEIVSQLLEALRGMLDMATDSRTHGPEIDRACAAIEAAGG